MATEAALLPPNGLDGRDWDTQSANLHAAAIAFGAAGANVRGGVVPATGNPLSTVVKTGLTVTVKAGRYLLPASDAAHGAWPVELAADVDIDLDTAISGSSRTDWILIQVKADGTDAGSYRKVLRRTGSAGAEPTAPTGLGTGGYAVLSKVTVPSNAVTLVSGNVSDVRQWLPAGVLRLANLAAAQALADAGMQKGVPFYDEQYNRLGLIAGASAVLLPDNVLRQQSNNNFATANSTDWTISAADGVKQLLSFTITPQHPHSMIDVFITAPLKIGSSSKGNFVVGLTGAATQTIPWNTDGLTNCIDRQTATISIRTTGLSALTCTVAVSVDATGGPGAGGVYPPVECRRINYTYREKS